MHMLPAAQRTEVERQDKAQLAAQRTEAERQAGCMAGLCRVIHLAIYPCVFCLVYPFVFCPERIIINLLYLLLGLRRRERGQSKGVDTGSQSQEVFPTQKVTSRGQTQAAAKKIESEGVDGVHILGETDEFEIKLKECESLIKTTSSENSVFHAMGTQDFLRNKTMSQEWEIAQEDRRQYIGEFAEKAQDRTSTVLKALIDKITLDQLRNTFEQTGEQTGAKKETDRLEVKAAELEHKGRAVISKGQVVMSCKMLLEQLLKIADKLDAIDNNVHMPDWLRDDTTAENYINQWCETHKVVTREKCLEAEEQPSESVEELRKKVNLLWNRLSSEAERKRVQEIFLRKRDTQEIENTLLSEQILPVPTGLHDDLLSQVLWCEKRCDFLRTILDSMLNKHEVGVEKFLFILNRILKKEVEAMNEIMGRATNCNERVTIEKVINNLCQQYGEYLKEVVNTQRRPASWKDLDHRGRNILKECVAQRRHLQSVPKLNLLVLSQITGETICCLTRLRGDENGARYVRHQYTEDGQIESADVNQTLMQHIKDSGKGFLYQYEGRYFGYFDVNQMMERIP